MTTTGKREAAPRFDKLTMRGENRPRGGGGAGEGGRFWSGVARAPEPELGSPGACKRPLLENRAGVRFAGGLAAAKPAQKSAESSPVDPLTGAGDLPVHVTTCSSARRRTNRVFKSHDDILGHHCFAWNMLIDMPWKIISIETRDWAYRS